MLFGNAYTGKKKVSQDDLAKAIGAHAPVIGATNATR